MEMLTILSLHSQRRSTDICYSVILFVFFVNFAYHMCWSWTCAKQMSTNADFILVNVIVDLLL